MVNVLTGLVGGLVATMVMAIGMRTLGDDSPPPTALLWAKFVGDEGPEAYMMQGMALHFVYGIVAGVVYFYVFRAVGAAVGSGLTIDTTLGGIVWGIVWAIVLFVVFAAVWMRTVLGVEPDQEQIMMAGVNHLVYGLVLGLWVGGVQFPA